MTVKTYLYDDWSKFAYKGDTNKELVIERRFYNALVRYNSALRCFKEEMYDAAADRLYFTWLSACRGLLLSIDKETANVYILFLRIYLHFVALGILPRKDYDRIIEVYNLNQKNFSNDMIELSKAEVEPFLDPTNEFLGRVADILNFNLEDTIRKLKK